MTCPSRMPRGLVCFTVSPSLTSCARKKVVVLLLRAKLNLLRHHTSRQLAEISIINFCGFYFFCLSIFALRFYSYFFVLISFFLLLFFSNPRPVTQIGFSEYIVFRTMDLRLIFWLQSPILINPISLLELGISKS